MIIVSQDKKRIVNFDNLTQIYITQDEEETATFIRYETVDSLYDDLAEYKTEERAKEVLQEIIEIYREEIIHGSSGYFSSTKTVYDMPKE